MPKAKIEEYNYFICSECDKDGTNRLSPEEFQKHLVDVHGILTKEGKRSMLSHLDGANWFVWNYEWTIGGKTFTQHIRQARHHKVDF